MTSPELVILGITLCGPELVSVPIGAVELCGVPTAPGTVSAAVASRALILFVAAFSVSRFRRGFRLPRNEREKSRGSVVYQV